MMMSDWVKNCDRDSRIFLDYQAKISIIWYVLLFKQLTRKMQTLEMLSV